MSDEFRVLVLPADLNETPNGEDIILLISEDEFMTMWKRGEAMVRNRALKGKGIDAKYLTTSIKLS